MVDGRKHFVRVVMNKKEKMDRFVELQKELLTLQENVPDEFLRSRIKVLTQQIENETLDFSKGMNYILVNMKKAKRKESVAIWFKVMDAFKKYFADIQ